MPMTTDVQAPARTDLVYFLHIPKTSGSSLWKFLQGVAGPDAATPPLLWQQLVSGQYRIPERTRVITGHFAGLLPLWLRYWPRVITMLREPLARALSHINHVQSKPDHPLHRLAAGLSVTQFCRHPLLWKTIDNTQARYLASLANALDLMPRDREPAAAPAVGVPVKLEDALAACGDGPRLFDAAVRALDAVDVVGITEAHYQSLQAFTRRLGWGADVVEFRINTADRGRKRLDALAPAEVDALAECNQTDSAVYRVAVEHFAELCGACGIALPAGSG